MNKVFEGFQKGVNLGGWISQFDRFDEEHFRTFITEKDIAYIASLRFDHVRVPVDYNVLEDEDAGEIEIGFSCLDNCRDWCRKYGLNMLIDLHECYGYSFDPLKKDMDRKKFFYDEALQARFFALWRKIAERYKDDVDMIAFEPLNEVVLGEVVDAWNEIAGKFIRRIREIAPTAYVVIGGVHYNNVMSVPLLNFPVDDHVVFNFHCYEPMVFTHQGAYWVDYMPGDYRIGYPRSLAEYRKKSMELSDELAGAIFSENAGEIGVDFFDRIFAPAVVAAEKADVALYCGEYGVIDLADNEDKLRWLIDIHTAFERYSIGHALWNYKAKDFGLVDERFDSIKERFIEIV